MTTRRELPGTRSRRATWGRTFLAVAVAVGAVGVVGLAPRSAQAAAAPSVAVPAYFWSSTQWDRMLVSSEELRYVVLNPDSGPGTVSYPSFVTKVAAARAQGATVVGYVDTSYGARALSSVKADIDKYRAWYGVNAFFFDQTPYDCADVAYYQDVEDYVRMQAGGFIFHNPGMNPQECYLDVADIVVNFEGSEATYDAWTPAAYTASYPAGRFWHIVYAVDPAHAATLLSTAAGRNGGLVFLTEQNMPNPFAVIPTEALWIAQTPTRAGRKAAPQAAAPSTTAPVPTTSRVAAPQGEASTTTTPAGASAEAPVTTRPSAPVAATETTTTTALAASAQSAPVPPVVEAAPSSVSPSPNPAPTTALSATAPAAQGLLSQATPVPALLSAPTPAGTYPIVPPVLMDSPPDGPESAPVPLALPAGAVPVPPVNRIVTSQSTAPTTTRPTVGPALTPSVAGTKLVIRIVATRDVPTRRPAVPPKKAPIARRGSVR